MAFWLFKSEPDEFSWGDQVALGEKGGPWHGIRNYQARNNMRSMLVGETGFFYHSSTAKKAIVGIIQITAPSHPDSTTDDPRWDCVDVKALRTLARPVTLDEIRTTPKLADMVLVRNSRLSVQPVTEAEWRTICAMGGSEP